MGEGTDQTVKEIEETRERLSESIDELGTRVPSPPAALQNPTVKKAAAGGAGGLAGLLVLRRMKRKRRAKRAAATSLVDGDGAMAPDAAAAPVVTVRKPRLRKTRRLLFLGSVAGNAVQYRQAQQAKKDRGPDFSDS